MKTIFLFILLILPVISFALETTDTHPQLCENIRAQLSEDCSEESDTIDRETGALVKRTYQECYSQNFASTVQSLNEYLTDELGVYTFDVSGDNDQIVCDKGE